MTTKTSTPQKRKKTAAKPKVDPEAEVRQEMLKLWRLACERLQDISDKLEYLCADRRRNSGG